MYRLIPFLIPIICLMGINPILAQDDSPLLIAQGNIIAVVDASGDIQQESWCETAIRSDTQFAEFAPDGSAIVYQPYSPIWEEAIRRTSLPASPAITDIIVCQPDSDNDIVFVQPDDASLFVPDVDDMYIERSVPVWSPDSAQLAWLEAWSGDFDAQELVILTVATDNIERRPFPNVIQSIRAYLPPLTWTPFGIVASGVTNDEENFVLYDMDTGELETFILPKDLTNEGVNYVFPLVDSTMIVFRAVRHGWHTLDFDTGEVTPLSDNQYVEQIHISQMEGQGLLYIDDSDSERTTLAVVMSDGDSSDVQIDPLHPSILTFRQPSVSAEGIIMWHNHEEVIILRPNQQPSFVEQFYESSSLDWALWAGDNAYRIVTWNADS